LQQNELKFSYKRTLHVNLPFCASFIEMGMTRITNIHLKCYIVSVIIVLAFRNRTVKHNLKDMVKKHNIHTNKTHYRTNIFHNTIAKIFAVV